MHKSYSPIFTIRRALVVCFICIANLMLAQTTVSDPGDLQEMVNAASGGGTFIVPNGTYNDFEASFSVVATAENPIIVKAESVGGVILTGDSHFTFKKSAYITLEGFEIYATGSSTLIKLEGSNNIRISRNVFELTTTDPIKWVYIGGVWDDNIYPFTYPSHDNRIDHNIFQNKATPGHYITVDGTTDANDVGYQSQYDRIDHNYFKNNSPRAVNEQESIRVGWSDMSKSSGFTTVEFNLFEDCDGDPEIVSIKSSDNTVRHNTFISSYGTLSFRHGNRNRAEGNYFFGNGKEIGLSPDGATLYTGGMRIYGTDHVIINNYMEGLTGTRWDAPITITQGDAIEGNTSDLTKHYRAERVTVAFNTLVNNSHGIEIGYDKPGSNPYNTKVKDIVIANNLVTSSENSMVEFINGNDQGEEITWSNNLMYPTGDAVTIVGASTTVFDDTQVQNVNPHLEFDAQAGVWRSTGTTPTYTSTIDNASDIEGQDRPASSNPGADHYSLESVRYEPLSTLDVGPDAYEDDVVVENFLRVSGGLTFDDQAQTSVASIQSDMEWTITSSASWLSVRLTNGSGSTTFDVMVEANISATERTGTITVDGGSITKTISVTQNPEAIEPVDVSIPIINAATDVFEEPNIPANAYDNDPGTRWSGQGVGTEIVFELDGAYRVDSMTISFLDGDARFSYFEIEISTNGVDFTPVADNLSNSKTTNNEEAFDINASGTFIKIIGNGNSVNLWNSITEVNFYGEATLITSATQTAEVISIYPNPTSGLVYFSEQINYQIIDALGNVITEGQGENVDISSVAAGLYFVKLTNQSITSTYSIVKE